MQTEEDFRGYNIVLIDDCDLFYAEVQTLSGNWVYSTDNYINFEDAIGDAKEYIDNLVDEECGFE